MNSYFAHRRPSSQQRSTTDQLVAQYQTQARLPAAPQRCAAHRHPKGPEGLRGLSPEARDAYRCAGHLSGSSCDTCGAEHAPRPIHIAQGMWPTDATLLPFPLGE